MTVVVEDRRKVIIRRVFITLVVLACIAGLVVAANRTDTGEPGITESGGESITEALVPTPDSEVLRQAQVGVDLVPGWTGVLIVNGIEIPEDQLLRRPELYAVYYLPGDGKVIEQLPAGENCAEAQVWRVEASRASARPIRWCFEVT